MIALNNKQKLYNLLATGSEYSKETLVKLVSHRFSEYVRQLRLDGCTIFVESKHGTTWYRMHIVKPKPQPQGKQLGIFDN